MKKLLASAATLMLLAAAPALAADEHHEHGSGQGGGAPHAQGGGGGGAPHAQGGGGGAPHVQGGGEAPHAMSAEHPDRNPNHGAMGGGGGLGGGGGPGGGHHGSNNFGNNNSHMGGGMAGPNHGVGHGPRVTNFNSYHRNFRSPQHYHVGGYHRPQGWYAHRWAFGEILPALFFGRDYWIDDYYDYGLVEPPYGATWVRYGDDALLIDESSGEVIQVAYGVFY